MSYSPNDILLAKYRIEALIGRGAFAEVYHATQLKLHAPRAIKLLHRDAPGLGSSDYHDFERRFELEAQLGAQIDHPHVIRVHDFDKDGDTLLLVMEYAAGGSLAEKLAQARKQKQPLNIQACVDITRQVAEGLAALHALDAVHRDIKPSNILFDGKGNAKLSDLGLAQVPGGPSMRSQLSQPMPHPGTPAYMSPEQVSITNYLTPASDVYALGLVLFEMLVGKSSQSCRPGTKLSDLRNEVPEWLQALVARMLVKEPEARPWDGAAVADLLREGIGNITKTFSPPAPPPPGERSLDTPRPPGEGTGVRESDITRRQTLAEAERIFDAALAKADWARAEKSIAWLRDLQANEEAVRLGMKLDAAHEAAAEVERQRQQAITKAEKECEAAIQKQDWQGAEAFIQQLQSLRDGQLAEQLRDAMNREKAALIEWVSIPAGQFQYGEYNKWCFIGKSYQIGKYPVTQAQYQKFIDANPSYRVPAYWDPMTRRHPAGKADHPVVCVNRDDAQEFCQWANCRLPTEEEWEKAARGQDGRIYPWGNEEPDQTRANFNKNENGTTPVGKYSPRGDSPYGCADMSGNVFECTNSKYDIDNGNSSPVLRGGSWDSDKGYLRVFNRCYDPYPGKTSEGFRVARDV